MLDRIELYESGRDEFLLESETSAALKGRDFLSLHDYTPAEVEHLLKVAGLLKAKQKAGQPHQLLAGKSLGMIFHKSSTRTRVSFEVAMWQLGGHALFLNPNELQMGRGESIADTARILSRYLDGIMIRTYGHEIVTELAANADVPVINGLTDLLHPCQALADYFTIWEKKGRLAGIKVAFVGDGNNMAHSLMYGAAKVGAQITVASPPGYEPSEEILRLAREDAFATRGQINVTNDPAEAVAGADVIYTDVWASMGQESEHARRVEAFKGYQVNSALVALAKKDALVLHCLPAHYGEEITEEVAYGPNSAIFDEAENRLHVQKAILAMLLQDSR